MAIHNFIIRNVKLHVDFNIYQDENTVIHRDDYHKSINLDESQF